VHLVGFIIRNFIANTPKISASPSQKILLSRYEGQVVNFQKGIHR
jgi:hypothetical protein